jgi:hypothetical protein
MELGPILASLPAMRRALLTRLAPNSCLETSRAIELVLRRHGHPARLLVVEASLTNAAGWAHLQRGQPDEDRQALGVHSVHIGHKDFPQPGGFPGHVIVIVGEAIAVDGSIDQAHRPAKGIHVPGPQLFLATPAFLAGQETVTVGLEGGGRLQYTARPADESYRLAAGYRKAAILAGVAQRALDDHQRQA